MRAKYFAASEPAESVIQQILMDIQACMSIKICWMTDSAGSDAAKYFARIRFNAEDVCCNIV